LSRFGKLLYAKRLYIYFKEVLSSRHEIDVFNANSINKIPDYKDKMRILLAGAIGGNEVINFFENNISKYLIKHDFEFQKLICDKVLDACFECNKFTVPIKRIDFEVPLTTHVCNGCDTLVKLNKQVTSIYISDYVEIQKKEEFNKFVDNSNYEVLINLIIDDVKLGEHAYSATLRFFAKGKLEPTEKEIVVFKKFLKSAEIIRRSFEKILQKNNFEVVFLLHGLYVPHGVMKDVCNKRGIRVIIWNLGYRKNTFIFSEGETYHKTMISEPVSRWETLDLEPYQRESISEYLESRKVGNRDWISFVGKPELDLRTRPELKMLLENGNRNVILLTNVSWDAQIHYENNVFLDMYEWLFATINWFRTNTNINLIIRVHPAEVNSVYPSSERIADIILDKFENHLPPNIHIVDSSDSISTYSLTDKADLILIYGTKMGVELAVKGKQIIVAGEAWIRGKQLTIDLFDKKSYYDLLESHINLNIEFKPDLDRAIKYAYHYFYRRLFELDFNTKDTERQKIFVKNLNKFIVCLREKKPFEADFYS
jgi:hypothetical protein